MDRSVLITANAAAQVKLDSTGACSTGFSWATQSASTFDGGTFTLWYRPKNVRLSDADNPWIFLDAVTATEQATYSVGANMELAYTLTGGGGAINARAIVGIIG